MNEDVARCQLCGEPMPPGEEMFNYHGYTGPCPKPPLPKPAPVDYKAHAQRTAELKDAVVEAARVERKWTRNSCYVTSGRRGHVCEMAEKRIQEGKAFDEAVDALEEHLKEVGNV